MANVVGLKLAVGWKWRLIVLRLWLWLLNSCGKCCSVEVGCWLEVEADSSQAVVVVIKQLW